VASGISAAQLPEPGRAALPAGGRIATPEAKPSRETENPGGAETETETDTEEDGRWRPVLGMPCELTVDLALPDFTVADFLKLRPASVIAAHWRLAQDVPLRLNGRLIGWVEFEVSGINLAVRLTELA